MPELNLVLSIDNICSIKLAQRGSTGLSALRAIEHYRGRVLNHGRACQRCDLTTVIVTQSNWTPLSAVAGFVKEKALTALLYSAHRPLAELVSSTRR